MVGSAGALVLGWWGQGPHSDGLRNQQKVRTSRDSAVCVLWWGWVERKGSWGMTEGREPGVFLGPLSVLMGKKQV